MEWLLSCKAAHFTTTPVAYQGNSALCTAAVSRAGAVSVLPFLCPLSHLQHVTVDVHGHIGEVARRLQQLAGQTTATNQGSPAKGRGGQPHGWRSDTSQGRHTSVGSPSYQALITTFPIIMKACAVPPTLHIFAMHATTAPPPPPRHNPHKPGSQPPPPSPVLQQSHEEGPRVLGCHVPVTTQVGQHKQHQALSSGAVTVLAQPALDPVCVCGGGGGGGVCAQQEGTRKGWGGGGGAGQRSVMRAADM